MAQLDKGMTEDAIRSFKHTVNIRPAYGETWCNLGIAFHKQSNREKAIAAYKQAILVQPSHLDSYTNLGTGDRQAAISRFQKAARLGYEPSQRQLRREGLSW